MVIFDQWSYMTTLSAFVASWKEIFGIGKGIDRLWFFRNFGSPVFITFHGPDGRMGVLPTVFSDSRGVAKDFWPSTNALKAGGQRMNYGP
jgi:hypothetical protein